MPVPSKVHGLREMVRKDKTHCTMSVLTLLVFHDFCGFNVILETLGNCESVLELP